MENVDIGLTSIRSDESAFSCCDDVVLVVTSRLPKEGKLLGRKRGTLKNLKNSICFFCASVMSRCLVSFNHLADCDRYTASSIPPNSSLARLISDLTPTCLDRNVHQISPIEHSSLPS